MEVYRNTGCTASCGIGGNILIARLATRRAKPNGVHHVEQQHVSDFIGRFPSLSTFSISKIKLF